MEGDVLTKTPKEVLEDLDSVMDDLMVKMHEWERRLLEVASRGDNNSLLEEAGKGSHFMRKVEDVRSTLERTDGMRKEEGPPEEDPMREALDSLDSQIKAKCDEVSRRIERDMDAIFDRNREMSQDLSDIIDVALDLDGSDDLDPEDLED